MAKKDFRQDTEDIFGLDQVRPQAKQTAPAVKPVAKKRESTPVVPVKKEKPADERLTLKSYYITPKLYKALKLRSAVSDRPEDKDLSAIVRAALTAYLAEELKRV